MRGDKNILNNEKYILFFSVLLLFFYLWKVFIILRSRLSRLRTFCIRRHFTAVSSRLAGLMRWAVCLQTRISCLSSGWTGQIEQGRKPPVFSAFSTHRLTQSLQWRSLVTVCSMFIVGDLVGNSSWSWGWLRGYKDVFSQYAVSPYRGTNASRRWAHWPAQEKANVEAEIQLEGAGRLCRYQ